MCSHPRTGDATDEKIAEKNREKFNELNFLRLNHGLRQRVATQAIFAARWRRDNFKKIASPSQAKNRSCSRGLKSRATLKCCATPTRQKILKSSLKIHKFIMIIVEFNNRRNKLQDTQHYGNKSHNAGRLSMQH